MSPKSKSPVLASGNPRMAAPLSGVTIRMYRQGHGDCFLLAFRKDDGSAFYMLIDCGLWTGSEIKPESTIDRVIADIADATGGKLDLVVVTHEHMDHVNGFVKQDRSTGKPWFDRLQIERLWLAWTEDETDTLANELRDRFHDTLLALAAADARLGNAGHGVKSTSRSVLRSLISFETGDEVGTEATAADGLRLSLEALERQNPTLPAGDRKKAAIEGITNKKAIKYVRDRALKGTSYLRPDRGPYRLEGISDVKIFALGPPRDPKLLLSLNPTGKEEFKAALDGVSRGFLAAAEGEAARSESRIFPIRYGIPRDALSPGNDHVLIPFLRTAYGEAAAANQPSKSVDSIRNFFSEHYGLGDDVPDAWRQIDEEWLAGATDLALRLNNEVNNTSLVLAFELGTSGKVALFPGDAQRGSWISWSGLEWDVDDRKLSARELMGRTVFYKAGHHGSHNATLNGDVDDAHANMAWLALGKYAEHFVAAIPANEEWAISKQDWHHPLPAIEEALLEKARGRVFRSDRDSVVRPAGVSEAQWRTFARVENDLYFEYTISDD